MATDYSTIQQHQPLRVPAGWGKQEKSFVVQMEEILDDIYRRFGRLRLADMGEAFRKQISDDEGNIASLELTTAGLAVEVGNKISKTSSYQTADSIVTAAVSQAATAAAGAYIAKTTQYQDASSIVTEAVSESATAAANAYIAKSTTYPTAASIANDAVSRAATAAASSYIAKTTTYQDAASIVSAAVSQAGTAASSAYIAKTTTYQTAASIVTTAEGYTDNKLTSYSTTTQMSSAISTYVTNNAYKLVSGIAIDANGIDITGSKYVKIRSGGSFNVNSTGTFDVTSNNLRINSSDGYLATIRDQGIVDKFYFVIGSTSSYDSENYVAAIAPGLNSANVSGVTHETYPLGFIIKDSVSISGYTKKLILHLGTRYMPVSSTTDYQNIQVLHVYANSKHGSSSSYENAYVSGYGGLFTQIYSTDINTKNVHATTVYYSYLTQQSSRDIKHNINPLPSVGEKIDSLVPVSFVYDEDEDEKERVGFIYEDTIDTMPEICTGDESNKAISYVELIPMLVKEIQDLRFRVATIEGGN